MSKRMRRFLRSRGVNILLLLMVVVATMVVSLPMTVSAAELVDDGPNYVIVDPGGPTPGTLAWQGRVVASWIDRTWYDPKITFRYNTFYNWKCSSFKVGDYYVPTAYTYPDYGYTYTQVIRDWFEKNWLRGTYDVNSWTAWCKAYYK